LVSLFSFCYYVYLRYLHSFPTRRSSDLSFSAGQSWYAFLLCSHIRWTGEPLGLSGRAPNGFRARRCGRLSREVKLCQCPILCSRSEEHTSELQSRGHLVCRLLLEKKKQK